MKGLQIQAEEQHKKDTVGYMLLSLLITTGLVRILFSGIAKLEPRWCLYSLGAGIVCIFYSVLPEKYQDYRIPFGGGSLLLLILAGYRMARDGFYEICNEILTFFTGKSGKIYLDFPVDNEQGIYYTAAIITGLLVLLVWQVVAGRKKWMLALFMAAAAGLSIIGFAAVDYGWLLLAAGAVGFCFWHKMQPLWKGSSLRNWLLCAGGILLCLLLGAAIGHAVDVDTEFQVSQWKRAVHKKVCDEGNDAMPEGNLSNLGRFVKTGNDSLILTMEKPQKLYLRGMVGETYTGTSWEGVSEEANIEGETLFYWLHKNGFYQQNSIAKVSELTGNADVYTLSVERKTACKGHLYLPCALEGAGILDSDGIGETPSSSIGMNLPDSAGESYTVSYTAGSVPEWYEAAALLAGRQSENAVQEYLKEEQSYREFVYKNDLQLTNSAVGVLSRIFGQEETERSLSEVLELIQDTLKERLTYDESVQTLNGKNDFLQYTLEQSKCGYSVHYATAAVLMLRYFGVPARYAEGYYLSAYEASEYEAGEKIGLGEAHAHAWAEYYMDGVGWIPFEVTPGYIDEDELLETAAAVSDGMGDGTGNTFRQNPLKYAPQKSPKEEQQEPDARNVFRFEAKKILAVGILLLLVLMIALICWIIRRRNRLKRFWRQIAESDNRTAIVELYAYCMMLIQRFRLADVDAGDEIRQIHQEAMFSSHVMTEKQRENMREFTKKVLASCKKRNRWFQGFRYHWILWLYD